MIKFFIGLFFLSFTTCSFASLSQLEEEDKVVSSSFNHEKIIDKIKQLKLEGKKLGLFIGRTADESLPGDKDEKYFPEDKEIFWISGDIRDNINNDLHKEKINNHLHIVMDFNDDAKVSLLNDLFHKVVIDISTWKFFVSSNYSDPVERFSQLLEKKPTSTLMFESTFQFIACSDEITETEYEIYRYIIPQETFYKKTVSEVYNKVVAELENIFDNSALEEEQNRIKLLGLAEIRKEMQSDTYETNDINDIVNTYLNRIALPIALKEAGIPEKDPIWDIDHESIVRSKTTEHLNNFFHDVELCIKKPYYANRYMDNLTYFIAKNPKKQN